MATTLATSFVGGLGRSSNPANSIPFTSAADTWSLLTGAAGDDGKFVKYVHPGSFVFAAPSLQEITAKFTITGDVSASITANQNDYNPAGLSTSSVLRLTSDASRNITGLSGGEDGRIIVAFNVGANNIVLQNQNASSTAANRFLHPSSVDQTLVPEESVSYWYDATTARWRPFAYHFGKLSVARGGTNATTALNSDRMMISSSGAIVESAILRPGTGTMGELRFYETPASGTNYVALKAATALAGDVTWTLPTADGTSGQALTTSGAGVLSWTTISGGTSPFTSTGGVIAYATSTDRLRLDIGEVGDIGIEIRGRASLTANYVDVKTLTTDTQPIFAVNSAGRLAFGVGGSTATDTLLYRSGANTLTMDHVIISGTATAGGATALTLSPAAHTAQTVEKNDFLVNAHTNTITGAITTQRFNWFRQPTITAASALAVTTAATLAIEGAPAVAASATTGNTFALWVQTGLARFDGFLSLGPGTNSTIVTGRAAVTGSYHRIDTEGAAATDDLDFIDLPTGSAGGGTGTVVGHVIVIRAEDSARTVVAKDGTGNLKLAGDFSLTHAEDSLTLLFNGTNWIELARSDNSA